MRAGRRGRAAALVLAAILGAAPGRAAEPSRPPAEAPHLGTCGAAGGFLLPGTAGCLRLGGSVAAEGAWSLAAAPTPVLATSAGRAPRPAALPDRLDRSGLGVGARLTADMRLPTELGPVRVYVSLRGRNGVATDRAAR